MVAPVILLLVVFHYVPMLGNVIAFQDYSPYVGIPDSPFVGLANFSRCSREAFWSRCATRWRSRPSSWSSSSRSRSLAVLLNSVLSLRSATFVQGVVYLPHFFSWVLVVTLFQQMFGGAGLLAQTLRDMVCGGRPDDQSGHVHPARYGGGGLEGRRLGNHHLPGRPERHQPRLYEAAAVDGASRWRRLWHITLPGLRPVIVLLLILRLGDALNVGFEQFFLQRDAVGAGAAEVLDTFVYCAGC